MNNLESIREQLQQEHAQARRMYYNEDFSSHRIMQKYLDTVIDNIAQGKTAVSIGYEELAEFYLMTGLYSTIYNSDKKHAKLLLPSAAAYSYALLTLFNKECGASHASFVIMRKAVYLWASLFLAKWEEEATQAGDALIDSLSKRGRIIGYGNRLHHEAWFLIDLYSRAYETSYDMSYADHPQDMSSYDSVLQSWDTKDLVEVDKLVYCLCEAHLLIDDDPDEPEFEYLNFSKAIMKLYPYTVISLLAMRSFKGLANPEKYSHALMHTEVVEWFLSLNSPLPKPVALPYGERLASKLKATCPQVEMPEWLLGKSQ